MSIALDISKGIDPVRAFHDVVDQTVIFRVDGKSYTFSYLGLPFTLFDDPKIGRSADRELILKHGIENG